MCCFPRVRGDVPWAEIVGLEVGRFSPRTRGCSHPKRKRKLRDLVFPAYAGMFLLPNVPQQNLLGFPRVRGDVPKSRCQQ